MKMIYHKPVMLSEAINGLKINPRGVYVDVTFGGGGHSREILKHLKSEGRLFALDQDQDAMSNKFDDYRLQLIKGNFIDIKRHLKFYGVSSVDGILADFGVSSHQFDSAKRGFSTRFDGPLDMRMNYDALLDATHVVNEYDSNHLKILLTEYGELRDADKIVSKIIHARKDKPIKSTKDLINLISPLIPGQYFNKIIAKIFQAIRIEVNNEINAIKSFLEQTIDLLKKNGRLVCISYHSLEDRLVKYFIRDGKFIGEASSDLYGNKNLPFKKVGKLITPSIYEIKKNSRSRSGKLRIGVRV